MNSGKLAIETDNLELWTLLFVDDEPQILQLLVHLFTPLGYRVLTAESGEEGLVTIERESIDLVLSDMHMSGMTGAEFLERVEERWPETIRMLMTGHADMNLTIDSINQAHIRRYINIPWDNAELQSAVEYELHQKQLNEELQHVEKLIAAKHRSVLAARQLLNNRVLDRRKTFDETRTSSDQPHQDLRRIYQASVPVYSKLMELGEQHRPGHSTRVADQAAKLAEEMGLDEMTVQNIYTAGLLHDIGMIGMPDELRRRSYFMLTEGDKEQVHKHPIKGQAALTALEPLHDVGLLIRAHHERFDGKGYPDGLKGDEIPLGARVLAVADSYDAYIYGMLEEGQHTSGQALTFLLQE
ncbi:MAG: response regulator, partial [Gammaproteobacteria bacterium]|nr:response regulator [Gammaproteobacteria bacterium]